MCSAVQVILEAGKRSDTAVGTVLACSDTNTAADNLALGARKAGLQVVRLGKPATVRILRLLAPFCGLPLQRALLGTDS